MQASSQIDGGMIEVTEVKTAGRDEVEIDVMEEEEFGGEMVMDDWDSEKVGDKDDDEEDGDKEEDEDESREVFMEWFFDIGGFEYVVFELEAKPPSNNLD